MAVLKIEPADVPPAQPTLKFRVVAGNPTDVVSS